eukprot:TRINITY_DN9234_c0_g1_i3.p1 TRINITY_DN9234_c0_g1~~TRINITY_DN9234_c0_g1_i3.p1  ORF type:complete len:166 (+),score=35.18 TRINITY_DN9234_c0_g1_i3:631-1128(+)
MENYNSDLSETNSIFTSFSGYFHFLLACGFGLVILAHVVVTVVTLQKRDASIPWYSTMTVIFVTLLLLLVSSVSLAVSISVARLCDEGIGQGVHNIISEGNFSQSYPCVKENVEYYFFCQNSFGKACSDILGDALNVTYSAINYLEGSSNMVKDILMRRLVQEMQ